MNALATTYGWSEEAIFALPLDRALAYCDEIALSNGQKIARFVPELKEVTHYRALLKKHLKIR